jgi:hypothetical protein
MNTKIIRKLEKMNDYIVQTLREKVNYFFTNARITLSREEYVKYLECVHQIIKNPDFEIPQEMLVIEQKIFDGNDRLLHLITEINRLIDTWEKNNPQ